MQEAFVIRLCLGLHLTTMVEALPQKKFNIRTISFTYKPMLWTGKSGKMGSVTVSESLDYIVNSKTTKACNSPCLER